MRTPQKLALEVLVKTLLTLAISVYTCSDACGEDGETQLKGLRFHAGDVYRPAPNAPVCELPLSFTGQKIEAGPDITVSEMRVLQAVDDTGKNLIWTNNDEWPTNPGMSRDTVLAYPSDRAKAIDFEGEAELVTPTQPRLVFTNLPEHLNQPFRHPLLKKFQIDISVLDRKHGFGDDAAIQWTDPSGKLLRVDFLKKDGTEVYSYPTSEFEVGPTKVRSYNLPDTPLTDLELVLRLDVPVKREPFRFKIEKIPLAWVQPANLEVIESTATTLKDTTNLYGCSVDLTFKGGPLTNAAGILDLTIATAEGDKGEKFETESESQPLAFRQSLCVGGTATKTVRLYTKSPPPRMIKILEGDAELFSPTSFNGGFVKVSTDFYHPGKAIESPALKQNGVTLMFCGTEKFRDTQKGMLRTNSFKLRSSRFQWDTEPPEAGYDALLFSFDDPRSVVLGDGFHTDFFDALGNPIFQTRECLVPGLWLVGFSTLPQKAQFTIYLRTPKAIQRVHFKAENIPLN